MSKCAQSPPTLPVTGKPRRGLSSSYPRLGFVRAREPRPVRRHPVAAVALRPPDSTPVVPTTQRRRVPANPVAAVHKDCRVDRRRLGVIAALGTAQTLAWG